ncbi:AMP-binding protein [Neisseriaceae bacterium PsAf]|nr:AMP-binding protein [Neisseriaceae bacterium PsAf]
MAENNVDIVDVWPVSPLQEGLFVLHKLSQGKDPYHIQFSFRMEGNIDKKLLQSSIQLLLDRYPNLKAAFFDEDLEHPIQIIPKQLDFRWKEVPITEASDDLTITDKHILAIAKEEFVKPFDLTAGSSIRFLYISDKQNLHYLIMTAHHIIIDGWSLPVFFSELMKLYTLKNRSSLLVEPPNYRDYVVWLGQKSKSKALEKWQEYLSGVEQPTLLSNLDGLGFNITAPVRYQDQLSKEETVVLSKWCKHAGLTINSVFLFAWSFVLRNILNQEDVLFGLTVSGRPVEVMNVDSMIGLFINTVPCRVHLTPEKTVLDQIKKLQQQLFEMREYEFIGLTDIQRTLKINQLFDTLVIFQNTPIANEANFELGDAKIYPLKSSDSTHYPLTLVAAVVDDEFRLELEVRSDIADSVNAQYIVQSVLKFLKEVSEYEQQYLSNVPIYLEQGFVTDLNVDKNIKYTEHSIWAMFQKNVKKLSQEKAIIIPLSGGGEKTYTWTQLDALVRQISLLIKQKIKQEKLEGDCKIGIFLPRNEYFIASILACIKLNYTFVPFDYSFPIERIDTIANKANIKLILSNQQSVIDRVVTLNFAALNFSELFLDDENDCTISLDQLLYIIFTSGSTGDPKGVMASQRNIIALLKSHQNLYLKKVQNKENRLLHIGHAWSFAFDASWQPLICFLAGNTLVLLNESIQRDPSLFVEAIQQYQIDFIETSPTMIKHIDFNLFFSKKRSDLKILGLGGEAIDVLLWRRLSNIDDIKILNFYGPTETTVDAVVADIHSSNTPIIGSPLAGIRAEVLDNWLRPCAKGVIGELYLSGDQVTGGYFNDPETTSVRFVAGDNGCLRYRTGDLVSVNQQGQLIYHGRSDFQVKIRGFRVEPKDIEKNLMRDHRIIDSKVFPVQTSSGLRLAAAIILNPKYVSEEINTQIMVDLRKKVPAYLVPHYIVVVDEFPMTTNGKLNVNALPKIQKQAIEEAKTEIEIKLSKLVAKLLGFESEKLINVLEDLRNYGLDSILVIQLCNLIKQIGYSATPRMIVGAKTIREIASLIEKNTVRQNQRNDIEKKYYQLTPIMKWLVDFDHWQHFCQWAIFTLPSDYTEQRLKENLKHIIKIHPMLRSRIQKNSTNQFIEIMGVEHFNSRQDDWVFCVDKPLIQHENIELKQISQQMTALINPQLGVNLKVVYFPKYEQRGGHILIFIHHLVVDGVSWRILLDDFRQLTINEKETMPEITYFTTWSDLLVEKSKSSVVLDSLLCWKEYLDISKVPLGKRYIDTESDLAIDAYTMTVLSNPEQVKILKDVSLFNFTVEEVLLLNLLETVFAWYKTRYSDLIGTEIEEILIDRENHGRDEQVFDEYGNNDDDLSRTVGWFTTVAPLRLKQSKSEDIFEQLHAIKNQLALMPSSPLEYSLLQEQLGNSGAEIEFNYHGFLNNSSNKESDAWNMFTEQTILDAIPEVTDSLLPRTYALEINTAILEDINNDIDQSHLVVRLNLSANVFKQEDLEQLSCLWRKQLENTCQNLAKRYQEL